MSDGIIKFVQNENREFEEYDDTYDIVIHCETAEDRENVISILTAGKMSRAIDIVKAGAMSEEKTRTSPWISVREKLPECGIPVVVLLQGQHPEDVVYEVAELVDLSVDTKIQGKYWYKKGCGYLQHPVYVDGCGCFPGYEVVAWLPVPEKYEREERQGHETN